MRDGRGFHLEMVPLILLATVWVCLPPLLLALDPAGFEEAMEVNLGQAQGLGIPGMPGQMNLPQSNLPFPLNQLLFGSAMSGRHSSSFNASALNVTELLAALRNMSVTEVVGTIQVVVLDTIVRQYMYNDFFAGGLCLMLVSFIASFLRSLWYRVLDWLKERPKALVEIRVKHDNSLHRWLQEWLQEYNHLSTTKFDADYIFNNQYEDDDEEETAAKGKEASQAEDVVVSLLPEIREAQQFVYKGEKVWVNPASQLQSLGSDSEDGGGLARLLKASHDHTRDDLVISCYKKDLLLEILKAAATKHYQKRKTEHYTTVYRWSVDQGYWMEVSSKKARPLSSIILDCNPDLLIEDCRKFLKSSDWYSERGIPHRRGYLLYGPPGCGKTSLIKALAGELRMDVYFLRLSSKGLTDDVLEKALAEMSYGSLFILEDVDAAFKRTVGADGEAAREASEGHSLSFSGLLNALDGVTAEEGRVVIMTTNHIEKLDPALIRPGRVDFRLFLGLASAKQACGIFRRFYPEATVEQEAKVAGSIPDGIVSPAAIQGFFLKHRDDLEDMLTRLSDFVAEAQAKGAAPDEAQDTDRDAGKGERGEDEETPTETEIEEDMRQRLKRRGRGKKKGGKRRDRSKSREGRGRSRERVRIREEQQEVECVGGEVVKEFSFGQVLDSEGEKERLLGGHADDSKRVNFTAPQEVASS